MAYKDKANGMRRIAALALLALALSALALGLTSLGAPVMLARAGHASETPLQQAVTRDSPAVVRIVSVVDARLTCSACASDGTDIISPAASANPFEYYSSGSGAFVSPDGAILTADHVVDHSMNNPEEVTFVEQQAAQDIASRYNATSDQVLQLFANNPAKVSISFNVRFQRAYLSTQYTGAVRDTGHLYAFDITSVAASSPVLKQDTAIVRIDTSAIKPSPDFPYLTLATAPVQNLDTVTAIAFPADADVALNGADFTALIPPITSDPNTITSLLSPSVNQGSVTNASEVRSDGTPVYETSGIGSQGSSGGPVINDQGQVIGFVDAGTSTERITFIIPSSVVAKYTTQAGEANPPPGHFMTLWSKALNEYYGTGTCHWTNASADLTTLGREYPTFGGDSTIADQARLKAAGESCATTGGASTTGGPKGFANAGLVFVGACLLAVLALIGAVIFIVIALLQRKPAPARMASPAYPPVPVAAQTPYTPEIQARPAAPPPYTPPAQPSQRVSPAPYSPPPAHQAPVPPAPTGSAPWPGATSAQHAPRPVSPSAPPTRFCQNGHVVLEPDAAFCPLCGAPVPAPHV
jgi:S1-C subfamily serine protease